MWQPFRKEKEANDVFDYQECRWVLEAPSLSSNVVCSRPSRQGLVRMLSLPVLVLPVLSIGSAYSLFAAPGPSPLVLGPSHASRVT